MKFNHCLLLALLGYGAISGCATRLTKANPQQLDSWLEAGEFAHAYSEILANKVKASESEKQQLINDIAKQSLAHWLQVKEEATALADEERWKDARNLMSKTVGTLIDPLEAELAINELLEKEEASLYDLRVEEAIARGQWLSQEYELQKKLKNSTYASVLTPIRLQQLQSKQQSLASRLINYAEDALENNNLRRARDCYLVLNKIVVPEELTAQVADIGTQLSQNRKDNLANKQKFLASKLDQSIKLGQLVEATQQIEELKKLHPLPEDILMKIDAVNSVLSYNAEFLDEKAEVYYRDGKLELASTIWEYLIKLNPDRSDIQLKLTRSEKVLKNMQELRQKGHRAIN